MPRGRPRRHRRHLSAPVAAILDRSGFAGRNDDASWRLTGHVFGCEVSPVLVEILSAIYELKHARLPPRLSEDQTTATVSHLSAILDRAKAALADASIAAVEAGDSEFNESVALILKTLYEPTTGEQTRELLRRCRAIDTEARVALAESGGTAITRNEGDETVAFIGAVETGRIRLETSRRIGRVTNDEARNLLKRLGYIDS
jgi:hypothetical protein